ncbi:MAG: hypothetical protein ACUZ8I_12330 [Candidatus Scalindua sp.]
MPAENQLSNGSPDGTVMGQNAADKTAFHGSSPTIQQTAAVAVGTASAATGGSTIYGFATSTQADAIVTAVNTIRTILNTKGITA